MDTTEPLLRPSRDATGNEDILDEICYLISDENIYQFIISQISTLSSVIQAWIYRVDRSRMNDFRYAYAEEKNKEKDNKGEGSSSSIVTLLVMDGVCNNRTNKKR